MIKKRTDKNFWVWAMQQIGKRSVNLMTGELKKEFLEMRHPSVFLGRNSENIAEELNKKKAVTEKILSFDATTGELIVTTGKPSDCIVVDSIYEEGFF